MEVIPLNCTYFGPIHIYTLPSMVFACQDGDSRDKFVLLC